MHPREIYNAAQAETRRQFHKDEAARRAKMSPAELEQEDAAMAAARKRRLKFLASIGKSN